MTDLPSAFPSTTPAAPGDTRTTPQRLEDEFARRVFRIAAPIDVLAIVGYLVLFASRQQWGAFAVVIAQGLPIWWGWREAGRGRHQRALQAVLWPAWLANMMLAFGEGGYGGGSAWWLIVPPAVLIQAGAVRTGAAMIGLSLVELGACHVLRQAGWMPPPLVGRTLSDPQVALAVLGSSVCIGTTVWMGMRWRRELLQELDALRESAEEATRVKSRFIANISHEIRTPLNGIVGAAELLRVSPLDAGQAQAAQIIEHSAHALLAVVNDVLDFSKLEARRVELERIALDPRALAYDTAETFSGQAQARGVELWAHAAAEVPSRILSDPVRLRQILHNLVSNALKFTEAGEIRIEVAVKANANGPPELRFAVRDTGIGLDVAQQARLFHAFTQADISTTRRFGGTGLGLVICRELTQLLGGRLELDSAPGVGSTFALVLPLAEAPAAGPRPRDDDAGRRPVLRIVAARASLRDDLQEWAERAGERVSSTAGGTPDDWLAGALATGADAIVIDDEALRAAGLSREAWAARLRPAGLGGVVLLDLSVPVDDVPTGLVPLYKPARPLRLAAAVRDARRRPSALPSSPAAPTPATATPGSPGTRLASPAQDPTPRTPGMQPASTPSLEPASSPARPVVLLVEDNAVNQAVATALLRQIGLDCDVAEDGSVALDLLAADAGRFAAVLMDCQMPVLDGYGATRAWRAREAREGHPHLPIIAMTANSLAEAGDACTAAGMDDFVTKPFTLRDLKDVVERWIPGRTT